MRSEYFLRSAALILAATVVAALAACGPDLSEIETLRAMPEAQLTYPGSEEVSRGGDVSRASITGRQPAFACRVVGTEATPDELFAWYAESLEAEGWVTGGSSSRAAATGELDATAWERNGLIFRLSVLDPDGTLPEVQADWAYLYRTSIIVDRRYD